MRIIWSPTSLKKVEEIVEYVSSENSDAALTVLKKLDQRVATLEKASPVDTNESRVKWVRELNVDSRYLVIYEVKNSHIHILTVRRIRQKSEN